MESSKKKGKDQEIREGTQETTTEVREESLQKEGRCTAFSAPERSKGMRLQSEPGISNSDIPGDHREGRLGAEPKYNELSNEQGFWKYTPQEQLP